MRISEQAKAKEMNNFVKYLTVGTLAACTSISMASPVVNQQAIQSATVSVQHALTLKDDTKVQLKGYVVKALGDEKYQFQDRTGSIVVEIDDELWQGKAISAKTPLTILGEIDVDYLPKKRVEIDVEKVKF